METRYAEEGISVTSPGTEFTFSPFQHAFLKRDGCLEASSSLHAILRKVPDETRPIFMLFLDLAKAFNTMSHDALGCSKKGGSSVAVDLELDK